MKGEEIGKRKYSEKEKEKEKRESEWKYLQRA